MTTQNNFAARLGRWSARHRKTAIGGWLVFVVLALVLGGMAGTNTLEYADSGVGEAGHAYSTIYHAFPKKSDEGVVIQSTSL